MIEFYEPAFRETFVQTSVLLLLSGGAAFIFARKVRHQPIAWGAILFVITNAVQFAASKATFDEFPRYVFVAVSAVTIFIATVMLAVSNRMVPAPLEPVSDSSYPR